MPDPPDIESQVTSFVSILQALPAASTLDSVRKVLPCGFQEFGHWVAQQPDSATRSTMADSTRKFPIIEALHGFSYDQIASLTSIDPADPRLPEFQARVQAAWPSAEVVRGISRLLECAGTTVDQMLRLQKRQAPDSPAAAATAKLLESTGLSTRQAEARLALADVLTYLQAFRPGAPLSAPGNELTTADVRSPDFLSVFTTAGSIDAIDSTSDIVFDGATVGFLQSRTYPPGEPGTLGEGLTAYLYRVDLTNAPSGAQVAISSLTVPFGPVSPLPYAGAAADVFIVTQGGIGDVAPRSVRQLGSVCTISFIPAVAAGQSSYFFGIASRLPPADSYLVAGDASSGMQRLAVRAPLPQAAP